MSGSAYGTTGGFGSSYGSTTGATIFTDLKWLVQSQTNALVAPADSPSSDLSRLVEDASGNRVWWTYESSAGTWKGVQVA